MAHSTTPLPPQRMFDHYESEYLASSRKAMQDIEQADQLLPGIERDSLVKRVQEQIAMSEEIVQSMELEARSMAGDSKRQLVAQAKDYKAGIADMRAKLRAATTSSRAEEAARSELLKATDPTLRREADNQRARLMATTERMQKGTDKLHSALQVALETEQVSSRRLLLRVWVPTGAPSAMQRPAACFLGPCVGHAARGVTLSLGVPRSLRGLLHAELARTDRCELA